MHNAERFGSPWSSTSLVTGHQDDDDDDDFLLLLDNPAARYCTRDQLVFVI